MSRTAIMTTSKFKMHWFLLYLARYSAAQKALEPCKPNYTRNTRLPIYVRLFWIRVYSIRWIASRSKIFAIGHSIKRESILPLNRQCTAFCLIEPGMSKRKRFCGNYGQLKDNVVRQKMNTVRANRPADRRRNTELAEKKNCKRNRMAWISFDRDSNF